MPAYSFQERFVPFVSEGSKTHTIRQRRLKGFAKPGDSLYLYFGMRTKWCKKLREEICTNTRTIAITKAGNILLFKKRLDNIPDTWGKLYTEPHHLLNEDERNLLAWNDGFRPDGSSLINPAGCSDLMLRFWSKTHDLPFIGDIIYWEPKNIKP